MGTIRARAAKNDPAFFGFNGFNGFAADNASGCKNSPYNRKTPANTITEKNA
jgi:hypothetical protein